jgi:hypothetical protein
MDFGLARRFCHSVLGLIGWRVERGAYGPFTASALALCAAFALTTACGHKPSYSDIKPDQGAIAAKSPDVTAAGSALASPAGQSQAQPQPANQASAIPSFWDAKKGEIKDLPIIQHSKVVKMQYGPQAGFETMALQVKTAEPFDKITAFYDSAIKAKGWTITSNNRDNNNFSWQLAKGEDDSAAVGVTKGAQGSITYVSFNRLHRLPSSSSPSNP